MNIHFTTSKKLMFDEHYNLLHDGDVSSEVYKKIGESLPLKENGEKPGIIVVHMGSISGDIITIMKSITDKVDKSNKQEVYIYDKSTPEDFCYFCTVGKSEKNDDNYIINNTVNGKVREFMIKYRSYYTKIFNYTSKIIENSNISIEDCEKLSSLSSSLTILSKLNLNGKNITIKEDQPEMNFYLKIKKDESYPPIELEEKLINQLIDYINEKLETKDNLYITFIISSITSITEKNDITMKLTSNFSVE